MSEPWQCLSCWRRTRLFSTFDPRKQLKSNSPSHYLFFRLNKSLNQWDEDWLLLIGWKRAEHHVTVWDECAQCSMCFHRGNSGWDVVLWDVLLMFFFSGVCVGPSNRQFFFSFPSFVKISDKKFLIQWKLQSRVRIRQQHETSRESEQINFHCNISYMVMNHSIMVSSRKETGQRSKVELSLTTSGAAGSLMCDGGFVINQLIFILNQQQKCIWVQYSSTALRRVILKRSYSRTGNKADVSFCERPAAPCFHACDWQLRSGRGRAAEEASPAATGSVCLLKQRARTSKQETGNHWNDNPTWPLSPGDARHQSRETHTSDKNKYLIFFHRFFHIIAPKILWSTEKASVL